MKFLLQQFLLSMLNVEAFSAERHVSFDTSDQFKLVYKACSESEGCIGSTDLANCSQLLHLLSLRDEVDDVLEAGSHKVAVEGRENDDLALVGSLLGEFNDLCGGQKQNESLHQGRTDPHRCR